MNYLNCKWWKG